MKKREIVLADTLLDHTSSGEGTTVQHSLRGRDNVPIATIAVTPQECAK